MERCFGPTRIDGCRKEIKWLEKQRLRKWEWKTRADRNLFGDDGKGFSNRTYTERYESLDPHIHMKESPLSISDAPGIPA